MKIVVTNYTGDRGNWGCQATSRNLLRFLEAMFDDADVTLSTVPLPKKHRLDRLDEDMHGDWLHGLYSNNRPNAQDLDLLEKLTRRRFGKYFDIARSADIIIFQGEGSIGPGPNLRNTLLFGIPYLASHLWGKPVLSMNQTIYAKDRDDENAIRNLLSAFQLVAVREAASFGFARKLGLKDVVLCPDMAFLETKRSVSTIPIPQQPYFCVTGSAAAGHYDQGAYAELVESIRGRTGLTSVFLYSRDRDRLLKREPDLPTVSGSDHPDVEEIIPLLHGAKFVIGGRYHTAVSALAQGTPVILLPANTFKSEGLEPMLGVRCRVYDPSERDAILKEVDDIVSDEGARRQEIAAAVERLRKMHVCFGEYMAALCLEGDRHDLDDLKQKLQHVVVERDATQSRFSDMYKMYNTTKRKEMSSVKKAGFYIMNVSGIWNKGIKRTLEDFD